MPGQAPGIIQLSLRIPQEMLGDEEVFVHVGSAQSQFGMRLPIQGTGANVWNTQVSTEDRLAQ
jgi:hypothetical protein